jgi:multiple sugar transport system ATP-binding protein
VARLFGDPTINLLPCKLAVNGTGSITLFDRRVPIATSYAHAAGQRPDRRAAPGACRGERDGAPDAIPFDLDAVMPVNVRSVLYLRGAKGEELLATVGETEATKFGRGHRKVWVASRRATCCCSTRRAAS